MSNTFAQYFALCLKDSSETIPVKLHANDMKKGMVVQVAPATGISSAPTDNDETGIFAVLLEDGKTGEIVSAKRRGTVLAMTGDTSAIGSFVVPMEDMMLNAQPVIALTGNAQDITPKPAFAKLLETGVVGALKLVAIVSQ
jgi:hypothetical protein